jgi:hypothetical protein
VKPQVDLSTICSAPPCSKIGETAAKWLEKNHHRVSFRLGNSDDDQASLCVEHLVPEVASKTAVVKVEVSKSEYSISGREEGLLVPYLRQETVEEREVQRAP